MGKTERASMACPFNGKKCINGKREDFPKNEIGEPATCRFWTGVAGMDPQTGEPVNDHDCAVAWLPMLLIEGANMTRHATASVDKTANILFGALPDPVQQKVLKQMPSIAAKIGDQSVNQLENKNGVKN